jgi:cytidylate kinase
VSGSGVPPHVISIDGGAGTGKTTSAQLVARRLGFCYVDSGAVYRAIAVGLRREGIVDSGDARVADAAGALAISIHPEPDRFRVLLGEEELTRELRQPEIGELASRLAVLPPVRAKVRALLRAAGALGPLVVEGRDIGTVVFPDALLKVYLSAELPVRADRRRRDLRGEGVERSPEEVERELAARDHRDSTRADSPLAEPAGALRVDTTRCSIEQQVETIVQAYRRARAAANSSGGEPAA